MISFFNAINTYTDASLTTDKYGNTVTCSGFITTFQGKIIDQGRLVVVGSTNNYGEIMAIEMGVKNLLSYAGNNAFLNLFSDSEISVMGLKYWIYGWLRDRDPNTFRLRSSTGQEVANQEVFCNVIDHITKAGIRFNIYHQRGHKNPNKPFDVHTVIKTFKRVNGEDIGRDIVQEICRYNDTVDVGTRDYLNMIVHSSDYSPYNYMKKEPVVNRVLTMEQMKVYKNLIA